MNHWLLEFLNDLIIEVIHWMGYFQIIEVEYLNLLVMLNGNIIGLMVMLSNSILVSKRFKLNIKIFQYLLFLFDFYHLQYYQISHLRFHIHFILTESRSLINQIIQHLILIIYLNLILFHFSSSQNDLLNNKRIYK